MQKGASINAYLVAKRKESITFLKWACIKRSYVHILYVLVFVSFPHISVSGRGRCPYAVHPSSI